ncbi:MAG: hypothetical protein FWH03_04365 [Firmicutes bacterium]|nr:hypothetical protein [Bacillota bacterium]
MMRNELNPIEQEVNRIRLDIYEKTKHMTLDERIDYDRRRAAELIKKYNIKTEKTAK